GRTIDRGMFHPDRTEPNHGNPGPFRPRHFTPPYESPRANWLRASRANTTIGKVPITPAAVRLAQFVPMNARKLEIRTGMVWLSPPVSTNAYRYSFQDWINDNTKTAAAGPTRLGSMQCHSARHSLQPSTRAASRISRANDSRNDRKIRMASRHA